MTRRNDENFAGKLAVTFAVSALAFSVSGGAEERQSAYTMTAITNASYGERVTRGEYEYAIEKITAPDYNKKGSFESAVNLCVAYTKIGALESAQLNCDAAISKVRERMKGSSAFMLSQLPGYSSPERDLAVALSNRGVLRAVSGDLELARQDFAEAVKLETTLDAPGINLARLEMDGIAETYSAN
jgi:Flp pilus assembly protein TadD